MRKIYNSNFGKFAKFKNVISNTFATSILNDQFHLLILSERTNLSPKFIESSCIKINSPYISIERVNKSLHEADTH